MTDRRRLRRGRPYASGTSILIMIPLSYATKIRACNNTNERCHRRMPHRRSPDAIVGRVPTLPTGRQFISSVFFDNTFVRELPGDPVHDLRPRQVHGALYSRVAPTPVAEPRLMAHSPEVASLLGLRDADVESPAFAEVFGGMSLIRFGGHHLKGGYDGQNGIKEGDQASAATVL